MNKNIPLLIGMSLGLVACGGGSGGSSGGTSTGAVSVSYDGPSTGTATAIDSQEKADAAVSAAVGAVSGIDSVSANYKTGTAAGSESPLKMAIDESVDKLLAGQTNVLAGVTQTRQCQPSGTMVIDSQSADPNSVTAGDYTKISFTNCWLDYSTQMQGVISSEVKSKYGTPSIPPNDNWGMSLYTDIGFSMSSSNGMYMAMDGAFTSAVDYVYDTTTQKSTMSGDSLAMALTYGTDRFTQLMTNFDLSITENYSSGDISAASYNFTITNSLIGGSATVTTDVPFAQYAYEDYPHSGQVTVTGSNGGVRLTVNSAESVTISYDLDGDGLYGASDTDSVEQADREAFWSEL